MDTLLFLMVILITGIIIWMFFSDKPVLLIYIEIIYSAICGSLVSMLRLPDAITYLTDAIWVNIFVLMVADIYKKRAIKKGRIGLFCAIGVFFVITLCSWFLNGYGVVLYLWGIRNNFKFIIFILECAYFLDMDDIKKLIKIVGVIFVLSIVFATFQHYVLGLKNDFVGGTYGIKTGCNGGAQLMLTVFVTYVIVRFLDNKMNYRKMILTLIAALYFSAISELKIFFVQLVITIIVAIFLTKRSQRTLVVMVVAGVGLVGAYLLIAQLYPQFADFFNVTEMLDYSTGSYSSSGEVNRLDGIIYVYNNIFSNMQQYLFGVGLGNADNSSFFTSDFYYKYGEIKYEWFQSVILYIENGLVGLISYLWIIVYIGIKAMKRYFECKEDRSWYAISIIAVLMSFMIIVYNNAFRVEFCYIYAILLAIPFLTFKEDSIEI